MLEHRVINRDFIGVNDGENPHRIAKEFDLLLDKPLQKFSSEFAKAYEIKDLSGEIINNKYAIIFKQVQLMRFKEVIKLAQTNIPNLSRIIALEITKIEEKEHIVCIVEKPLGISIKELLNQGIKFEFSFAFRNFIEQLVESIHCLHKEGIMHGEINTDNIYFIDEQINNDTKFNDKYIEKLNSLILNQSITILNPISNLYGAEQSLLFESIDRAKAHSYAKGNDDNTADYYALGMSIFSMIAGNSLVSVLNKDLQEMISGKLNNGSYAYVLNAIDNNYKLLNHAIFILIKNLLIDDKSKRWGYHEVMKFLNEVKINITDTDINSKADINDYTVDPEITLSDVKKINCIEFNKKKFYSLKSLAYAFSNDWEEAKKFVKTEKFNKLLLLNIQDTKLLSVMTNLYSEVIKCYVPAHNIRMDDLYLAHVIIALDPTSCIMLNNLTFNYSGIGQLLVYSIINKKNDLTQQISELINSDIFSSLYRVQQALFSDKLDLLIPLKENIIKLLSAKKQFNNAIFNNPNFSLYRCIYSLTDSLPYQSITVGDKICISLQDILYAFEELEEKSLDHLAILPSFIAFIIHKLSSKQIIKLIDKVNIKKITENDNFKLLAILAVAQRQAKLEGLFNTCEKFAEVMKELIFRCLHGTKNKAIISKRLEDAKAEGSLIKLLKIFHNKIILRDAIQYNEAQKKAESIRLEYDNYRKYVNNNKLVHEKGLALALKLSYITFFISIIMTIIRILTSNT